MHEKFLQAIEEHNAPEKFLQAINAPDPLVRSLSRILQFYLNQVMHAGSGGETYGYLPVKFYQGPYLVPVPGG